MDILRAALGDRKLTYLGKSYGTYLGTYYAQLFPHNVRALVLDGALDPAETAIDQNIVQAEGFQVAFRSFAADCVRRPDCPLGSAGRGGARGCGRRAVTRRDRQAPGPAEPGRADTARQRSRRRAASERGAA